ncbi:MAG: YdcF family protein [Bacteroidota bacterium]
MFFVLSKVLLIFILPFTWILAFSVAALVTRNPKRKRRFFITSFVLLLIFSSPFVINQFARLWDIESVPLTKKQYSCVIVLGGFAGVDAKGEGLFNERAERFIQAVKLVNTGKAANILMSGGNGLLLAGEFREGAWVKTQLQEFKVPDSLVIVENNSRNTYENAEFSKKMLIEKHLQGPYLLVTSAWHMRRSMAIFKKQGLDVIPYPCDYIQGRGKFSFADFIPSADPLSDWNLYMKEVFGSIAYHFK